METASIILLFVSASFFASDYCYGVEMQQALKKHEAKEACVIPLLVRPVEWKDAPFAHLQVLPMDRKPLSTWQDEDTALTGVVAGIRRVLEDFPLLTTRTSHTTLPAIWNIPFTHNPFFTGRQDVLEHLHVRLQTTNTETLSHPQAITGLAGVGKTQIALEYAYRFRDEYQAILWANAETIETLNASFTKIARFLHLSQQDAKEQEKIIQAVKHWLQRTPDWLLRYCQLGHRAEQCARIAS